MNIADIYKAAPGSRFLAVCSQKAQEEMVDTLCSAMPDEFREKTLLNTGPIVSMDVAADDHPNRFSDLLGLCGKLVISAGRRSHFEGLLLLNVSGLTASADRMRLKALGEVLALKDGLASKCVTLIYGPEKEREILQCADDLDFDGRLKVISFERSAEPELNELLEKHRLRCGSVRARKRIQSVLQEMAEHDGFSAGKFIRICGNDEGVITAETVSAILDDPYSYVNRIRKAAKLRGDSSARKIGFQSDR
ncbi:MAG: hypothetical protein IJE08_01385 [Clostridia bacterium]|nr:hypothetical protein [Clostridia bacterium]